MKRVGQGGTGNTFNLWSNSWDLVCSARKNNLSINILANKYIITFFSFLKYFDRKKHIYIYIYVNTLIRIYKPDISKVDIAHDWLIPEFTGFVSIPFIHTIKSLSPHHVCRPQTHILVIARVKAAFKRLRKST